MSAIYAQTNQAHEIKFYMTDLMRVQDRIRPKNPFHRPSIRLNCTTVQRSLKHPVKILSGGFTLVI
jgi:hypothetical protein